MKKKISLPVQILIALAAGIAVGLACLAFAGGPEFTTSYLKPFGDIFVNLLKFIVVPVVLLSMIDGILSMDDMKKVGAVGWKTVAYFLVTTAIACVIGLAFANPYSVISSNFTSFPIERSLRYRAYWNIWFPSPPDILIIFIAIPPPAAGSPAIPTRLKFIYCTIFFP